MTKIRDLIANPEEVESFAAPSSPYEARLTAVVIRALSEGADQETLKKRLEEEVILIKLDIRTQQLAQIAHEQAGQRTLP